MTPGYAQPRYLLRLRKRVASEPTSFVSWPVGTPITGSLVGGSTGGREDRCGLRISSAGVSDVRMTWSAVSTTGWLTPYGIHPSASLRRMVVPMNEMPPPYRHKRGKAARLRPRRLGAGGGTPATSRRPPTSDHPPYSRSHRSGLSPQEPMAATPELASFLISARRASNCDSIS